MQKIQLMDVTLRDGGYQTNFHFSQHFIKMTLMQLDAANLDYIEVGYRNGSFKPIANIGPAGLCDREYLAFCRHYIQRAKLTVILHPCNVQIRDLVEMRDLGVEAVRICVNPNNLIFGIEVAKAAKQHGFEVFINLTRISSYSLMEIKNVLQKLQTLSLQGIYFADSNGSLIPERVTAIFQFAAKQLATPLGFHAHDNLFLAQANSMAAMQAGAHFIDASINGLGKGAGNLKTEAFISYLNAHGSRQYNLCAILEAASQVQEAMQHVRTKSSIQDIIMGVLDLSQDDASKIGRFMNTKDYYKKACDFIYEYKKPLPLCAQA